MWVLSILNIVYTLRFSSSKYSLFHNSNVFGSCIIHILYTECAKIKKNNSGAKRVSVQVLVSHDGTTFLLTPESMYSIMSM